MKRPGVMAGKGFTLIELMVVIAIIGILAMVAIPYFLAYRDTSRVASVINTAEGLRVAFANYAVDSPGNLYPLTAQIGDWDTLRAIVNANGGELKASATAMHIATVDYTSEDGATYALQIIVNVPEDTRGRTVSVTPAGIAKE